MTTDSKTTSEEREKPLDNAITKARYWVGVLYPENMIPEWQSEIGDMLQLPYAYAVHDACVDREGNPRKEHIHLMIAFTNTTTYKHALEIFNLLSAPGKKAINKCEAVLNVRHCYDYLIHDTEDCKKKKKHLYPETARVTGNGFDIGSYEQIGQVEKQRMCFEMIEFVIDNGFTNMVDFTVAAASCFDSSYLQILLGYNSTFERYCRANYQKGRKAIEDAQNG